MSDTIKLNEKVISKEEFEKQKAAIAKQKGVTLIEVAPGEFKTRIQG